MNAILNIDNSNFYELKWESIYTIDYTEVSCNYIFKIHIENFFETIKGIYHNILSAEEISKAKRFRNIADLKRFVCGRYGLRKILSSYLKILPQNIVIKFSENKKPCVDGVNFNIAHSDNLVLLAISKHPVGIDLEYIERSFDFNSIIANSFSDQEISFIQSNSDKIMTFYKLWTRKEALLKATGEGLIDSMDQISILENKVLRFNQYYNLFSFQIDQDYLACFVSSEMRNVVFLEYY